MSISMFDTRSMVEMLEELKPASTFLKRTFFNSARPFDTEFVDVDIIKGKRRMAPFVSEIVGGKTVDRVGYETKTYKPVLVAPDMITTAETILKRSAGENVYGAMSPDERAAQQLGKDVVELDNIITRREEWMCSQALFGQSIAMVGEGVSQTLSFTPSTGHVASLGSGVRWNESGGDPLQDLRDARRLNVKDSGVNSNIVVMGSDALDAFLANAKVTGMLDYRRVEMGMIDPRQLPEGVIYYGYIKDIGCDIYAYDEWYLDDNGDEQSMVPTKKVLIGSTSARTDFLYGAVVNVKNGTFALPRVPNSWTTDKPSARFVQLSCRPLPVPTQIDAFSCLTVLA